MVLTTEKNHHSSPVISFCDHYACAAQGGLLDHVSQIYLEPAPSLCDNTASTADLAEYKVLKGVMQYVRHECLKLSLLDWPMEALHLLLASSDYHISQLHETHLKSPDSSPLWVLHKTTTKPGIPHIISKPAGRICMSPQPDPKHKFFLKVARTAQ